jgi:hypothetical protein
VSVPNGDSFCRERELNPECIVLTAMFGLMFPPENILRAGLVSIMKLRELG